MVDLNLGSALEFDLVVGPPPHPTDEVAASLDRCRDDRLGDEDLVARVAAVSIGIDPGMKQVPIVAIEMFGRGDERIEEGGRRRCSRCSCPYDPAFPRASVSRPTGA
ncbi:MAG: hypothetical protein ACJ77C_09350 [Chloroflexota bacterium]